MYVCACMCAQAVGAGQNGDDGKEGPHTGAHVAFGPLPKVHVAAKFADPAVHVRRLLHENQGEAPLIARAHVLQARRLMLGGI